MKKYCTSTNVKITVLAGLLALLNGRAHAKGAVAFVDKVQGHAFVLSGGATKSLTAGDAIPDLAEVVVEEGGQATLIGANQVSYHLSGAGQVKFMNKMLELKRGHVWFQTTGSVKGPFEVQTANGRVTYWNGEGIASYDQTAARTQFLAVHGSMEFSNLHEGQLMVVVDAGHFSFIEKDQDEGAPRKPTQIGGQSYKQFTGLFKGILPLSKSLNIPGQVVESGMPRMVSVEDGEVDVVNQALQAKKVDRRVASVPEGTTIVRRVPAEAPMKTFDAGGFHKKKLDHIKAEKKRKKVWTPESEYTKKSDVVVKVFGSGSAPVAAPKAMAPVNTIVTPARVPASVQAAPAATAVESADAFESTLLNEYKNQMRHTEEVNGLIDKLKSYKQDYQQEY